MIGQLGLERPLALVGLLLPLAYLLFARHHAAPTRRLVGSLALWTRTQGISASRGAHARPTWRVLVLGLALGLVALAVAGPRLERSAPQTARRLVVGTGPAGALAPAGGPARVERALETGRAFVRDHPGGQFTWIGPQGPRGVPPQTRALIAAPARDWRRWDSADCIWLPVSGATPEPEAAHLLRPAFDNAPGAVARTDAGMLIWDGGALLRVVEPGPRPVLRVSGAALAPEQPLGRFAAAWAEGRGWRLERLEAGAGAGPSVLSVVGPERPAAGETTPESGRVARDGWGATAEWVEAPLGSGLEPFLTRSGQTLVASDAGRIELALVALGEPEGDPAAFAVSWGELFERASLPPRGVVALERRRAAGAREERLEAPAEPRSTPLEAPLAAVAALLFLLARR